jgi:Terminase RNaseH-like domain
VSLLDEFVASRWDIAAWSRLLGVEPHPGQQRFFDALLQRDQTRWRARWLTIALSSGNRAGKTLALALAISHHTVHKIGLRPANARADRELETWSRAAYHWYHFGISQEIAELVYQDLTALLEGRHAAQGQVGCPLTDAMGVIAETNTKERGEYRWVQFSPLLGGGEIHFRTTGERALGSLGKDMHGISFDECGFETNLTFIVNEVLHFRRLSTGGPLLLVSTPSEGFTQFADEWKRGDQAAPDPEPDHISLRMSTRENVGHGLDQQMFGRLVAGYPPELVPQNIDGYFIEGRQAFFNHAAVDRAFTRELPVDQEPLPGHRYVQGIDPALTNDATWSIVLDVAGGKGVGVLAERRKGKQTMLSVVNMVTSHHDLFSKRNECVTGLDTTGFGGKVFRDALSDIAGLRNVEFGGTKARKVRLLTDLKGLLEQGRLRFPREGVWLDLRRQLLGFRIEDPARTQHDDAVMALAIAVRMLLSRPDESAESVPFAFFGQNESEEIPEAFDTAVDLGNRPGYTDLDRYLGLRREVVTSRLGDR